MSSYPTSLRFPSSSSRWIGSPSQWMTVSCATIPYSGGSTSTTLNSTCLMPPRTVKRSPCRTGRYDSRKYGAKKTSKSDPVRPSTVSAMGRTAIRLAYFMSGQGLTVTTSPCLTLRLCLTTRFIRALPSSKSSSARTISTVSFRFLPLTRTVSPRNSWRVSMVLLESAMTELSSLTASVTIKEFGFFFFLRIAVWVSSAVLGSAPEASLRLTFFLLGVEFGSDILTFELVFCEIDRKPKPSSKYEHSNILLPTIYCVVEMILSWTKTQMILSCGDE